MAERLRYVNSGAFAPDSLGADDGIRTRDPHLGKVLRAVSSVTLGDAECR